MTYGALSYWFYKLSYKHDLVLLACRMPEEWQPQAIANIPKTFMEVI